MDKFELAGLLDLLAESDRMYMEFLRVPSMSAGLYVLPEGGVDPQSPHTEDEMYFVVRGRARIRVGAEDQDVQAGTAVYVPAEVEHRFYSIEEELVVIVFFAPAEYTLAARDEG